MWQGIVGLERHPDGDPRKWLVTKRLTFVSEEKGLAVTVLPGLVVDGASVPRAFWWYASPLSGKHTAAAIIHDGLYKEHILRRKEADEIFLEAMQELGVRIGKQEAMYASVRIFGRGPWNKGSNVSQSVKVKVLDDSEPDQFFGEGM